MNETKKKSEKAFSCWKQKRESEKKWEKSEWVSSFHSLEAEKNQWRGIKGLNSFWFSWVFECVHAESDDNGLLRLDSSQAQKKNQYKAKTRVSVAHHWQTNWPKDGQTWLFLGWDCNLQYYSCIGSFEWSTDQKLGEGVSNSPHRRLGTEILILDNLKFNLESRNGNDVIRSYQRQIQNRIFVYASVKIPSSASSPPRHCLRQRHQYTVSGQNTIGRELNPLVLVQRTGYFLNCCIKSTC